MWQPRRAADTSTNWRQSLFCCCTSSMEQAADGAETAAIDGLVSSWSENISVSFCLRAPGYGLTRWCALGLLVGGAIQVHQLLLLLLLMHWRFNYYLDNVQTCYNESVFMATDGAESVDGRYRARRVWRHWRHHLSWRHPGTGPHCRQTGSLFAGRDVRWTPTSTCSFTASTREVTGVTSRRQSVVAVG